MDKSKEYVVRLFERPNEPLHMPKGKKMVAFKIPSNVKMDPFTKNVLQPNFAIMTKSWMELEEIDDFDMSVPMKLGRNDPFSLFIPSHRRMAGNLIEIFMGAKTINTFLSMGAMSRDRLNPQLYNYALTVAILNRTDTKGIEIPALVKTFPKNFMEGLTYLSAMEEANTVPDGSRRPIDMPLSFSARSDVEEHRVAYWREDIGINLHHWHWHVIYPHDGPSNLVHKDRRGELFYFMHQQMLARYDTERLSNGMIRVKPFANLREEVSDGFFSKLFSQVSSPGRYDGSVLRDITREKDEYVFTIGDMETWKKRIYEAIRDGRADEGNGEHVALTERDGIDILGNMVEASGVLSPNSDYYGDLHNSGHVAVAGCHDPDGRHREPLGVMGDTSTAMRDPFFYRWHAFINDIFMEHKNTLPKYTVDKLDFPDVQVTGIEVVTPDRPANNLNSFWDRSEVDISWGLDYAPPGPVMLRFVHLNHTEFIYRIKTINNNNDAKKGTVRIFMAPKLDESGKRFTLHEQKDLMIHMDKFTVLLNPGENTIERRSTESTLTIPFERTFPKIDEVVPVPDGKDPNLERSYCGCGWPQHMLLPSGTLEGFPMDLFVMVSDYSGDEVKQDSPGAGCGDAAIFCGIRDKKYPDARSMGYPFDRKLREGVETLAQFLTGNMATTEVTITFNDEKPGRA